MSAVLHHYLWWYYIGKLAKLASLQIFLTSRWPPQLASSSPLLSCVGLIQDLRWGFNCDDYSDRYSCPEQFEMTPLSLFLPSSQAPLPRSILISNYFQPTTSDFLFNTEFKLKAGMAASLLLPYSPISIPCLIVAGFFLQISLLWTSPLNRAVLWPWSWPSAICRHVLPLPPGESLSIQGWIRLDSHLYSLE